MTSHASSWRGRKCGHCIYLKAIFFFFWSFLDLQHFVLVSILVLLPVVSTCNMGDLDGTHPKGRKTSMTSPPLLEHWASICRVFMLSLLNCCRERALRDFTLSYPLTFLFPVILQRSRSMVLSGGLWTLPWLLLSGNLWGASQWIHCQNFGWICNLMRL